MNLQITILIKNIIFKYYVIYDSLIYRILFLKKKILFIYFREGKEGEREGEKQCVVASHMPPTGDLA